jgi:sialate O-acetylesterase
LGHGRSGRVRLGKLDELGRWSLYFSPGEAGGPFPMTIQGNNTLTLSDILGGDVWVASGQSNMELPMTRVTNARGRNCGGQRSQDSFVSG